MGNELTIRCSALPRIMACPASARRPEIDIDTSDETAALGTAVHAALATLIQAPIDNPSAGPGEFNFYALASQYDVDEDELRMLTWQGWHMWEKLADSLESVQCEVSMESHFSNVHLTGTADVLAIAAGKPTIVIIDWKSGRKEKDYLAQLQGYAITALAERSEQARAAMIACIDCAHVKVAVGWLRTGFIDVHEFTIPQIDDFEDDLVKAVNTDSTVYAPDESTCIYCPLSRECPARRALITAAGSDMLAITGGETTAMTPAALATLWPKSRMLKKALDAYEDAVKAAVEVNGGPITCSDGINEIGLKDGKRDTVYFDRSVLREFIPDSVLDAMRLKVPKGEIETAVSDAAPRGQKGQRKEACLAALRAAGAIEEKRHMSIDYRPIA